MHYTCNLQYILLSVATYMKLSLSNYLFPFGGAGMARGSIETKE